MTEKLYWEDFSEGAVIPIGEYYLPQDELIEFARKYDPQPFHIDPEAALESPLGCLCATGIHTMAICQRLIVDNLFLRTAFVAGIHMDGLRFTKPVLPEETLRMEITITGLRPVKDGKRGLVSYETRVYNPRNELAMTHQATIMVLRRPAD